MGTSNDSIRDSVSRFVDRAIAERHHESLGGSQTAGFHYRGLDYDNYLRLLTAMGQEAMRSRGQRSRFIIDEHNHDVIRQMWLWIVGSKECQWDLNRGIYLGGKIGCGKTILMHAFCDVLSLVSRKHITRIAAKDLYDYLRQNGQKSLSRCPLFIDELGRESVEVSDFGNRVRPFVDIMEQRYETGALTLITSNFMISTLSKEVDESGRRQQGYGEYICERVQETTNMVVLPGGSRRQMWNNDAKGGRR